MKDNQLQTQRTKHTNPQNCGANPTHAKEKKKQVTKWKREFKLHFCLFLIIIMWGKKTAARTAPAEAQILEDRRGLDKLVP